MIHETAYAKLNLALHVRERLPDGYHRIETVFAFCEDGDLLTARESDTLSLEVTGPFAAALETGPLNLVVRAAAALGARTALTLEKRIPVAAGLGGGSADAAAALRLLSRADDDLTNIAIGLGADVPACLLSRTARGEGRGDRIEPIHIEGLSGTPVLLVNPGVALSTATVFQTWDGIDNGPLGDRAEGRNDLEAPARLLVPEIGAVLEALSDARIARMSGSGASCFGLFDTEAERDAAAAEIAAAHPAWWLCQTRLR